ncbi:MAG: zinc-ribbon domain-containing protein [Oscillospiraceae bacterium]|nr:zinc-ribbon domain-containing protein [Oscillospiraceae bacterium]
MFCPKCGNKLPDNAKFCDKCGNPVGSVPNNPSVDHQIPPQTPPTQSTVERAPEPQAFRFNAPSVSGETAYGTIGNAAMSAVSNAIPGPGKVIGTSVKQFFTSIGAAFKDPKRLIPAFVLALVWLILNILQACGINPRPIKILSFFTFANGGMSGGVIGTIGGILGKGIFAGALVSLIGLFSRKGGAKRSFGETLKGAFGVSLDSLWAYLTGIGAAMLLYLFISGGATRISFMGGIAAAFLAARAALNNGFLRQLLGSFTKRKSPSDPNVQGLIRGLSVGFAASALIGLSNSNLILIIIGSMLLVGGIVMMILQATGVVKRGKGAQVQ